MLLQLSGLSYLILVFIIAYAGRTRTIGFGWSLLLGILFSPIVSLVAVLLSDRLPAGVTRWGCLLPGIILAVLFFIAVAVMLSLGIGIAALLSTAVEGGGGDMINI